MTVLDYLNLITSEHRKQPQFTAMIAEQLSLAVHIQDLLKIAGGPLYDIDVATGHQLDVIGQWVGVTRNVSIPITGIFFEWDGVETVGWEFGIWRPSNAPTSISTLPDDVYRTLIRTKIAANQWDGTTEGMYRIWDAIFTNITILVQDGQDMTYAIALIGGTVDSLTLALLTGGYLPLKPEGVRISAYYVSVDTGPVFGWDVESDQIQGWDEGSWVRELAPT